MKKGGGTSFSLFCHLLLFAIETDDKKEGGNSVHFFFVVCFFLLQVKTTKKDSRAPVSIFSQFFFALCH